MFWAPVNQTKPDTKLFTGASKIGLWRVSCSRSHRLEVFSGICAFRRVISWHDTTFAPLHGWTNVLSNEECNGVEYYTHSSDIYHTECFIFCCRRGKVLSICCVQLVNKVPNVAATTLTSVEYDTIAWCVGMLVNRIAHTVIDRGYQ